MLSKLRSALGDLIGVGEVATTEKRRHARRAVSLDASIYPIDFFSDVLIHNVSASGFKGEADVELTVGEKLHLTMDGKAFQTGTVRWTEGRLFGVSFDSSGVRTGPGSEVERGDADGQKLRARRTTLNVPARLSLGQPARPARVRDLSQSGMMLETDAGLETGQHVLIKLGDCSPIAGRVQWHAEDRIGVETAEPIAILALVYSGDESAGWKPWRARLDSNQ